MTRMSSHRDPGYSCSNASASGGRTEVASVDRTPPARLEEGGLSYGSTVISMRGAPIRPALLIASLSSLLLAYA